MIIVGELINASRKRIAKAIREGDAETIQTIAREQGENGADYIDVNAGVFEDKEVEYLPWLVRTVQEAVDLPCCLDSPNPKAIEAAMEFHRGSPILNSISLEKERLVGMLPLISGTGAKIVALCMSDRGMPEETDDRVAIADELINEIVKRGVSQEDIFVDALVQPISTNGLYGTQYLNAIKMITSRFPEVHTICGLSNISFGLPKRPIINRAFAVMAVAHGLDAAICNPLDRRLFTAITAAEALVGRDEYCEKYLNAFRTEQLEG